jgi:N6-adenosine-specific RNA methylase IME4
MNAPLFITPVDGVDYFSPWDTFAGLRPHHYRAILADPPWNFKTYSDKGRNRCPDWRKSQASPYRHYGAMDLTSIKSMPVSLLCATDCVLFLWGCWATLRQTMEVIDSWGFEYKTAAFVWLKSGRMGLGYWTRQDTEFCLLATKGKPQRLSRAVRQGLTAPRRLHSQKPDEVRERIEQLVPGPYVELFARTSRPGWDAWGHQEGTLDAAQGS